MSYSSKMAFRAVASRRSLVLISLCVCFILGAVFLMNLEQPRGATRRNTPSSAPASARSNPSPAGLESEDRGVVAQAATPLSARVSTIAHVDAATPGITNLLIPVAGVASNQLRDSFYDPRSEGRMHQALDIMAPRDTPVLAANDGTVMKLRQSERGGTMLYQSDPSGVYVFYYGHLSGYADGISQGKTVKRGEVIGYVGDTGNAGAGNFHLHFGISKMTASGKWYGGESINPYPLMTGSPAETIGGK